MGLIKWMTSPWGQSIPQHVGWYLIGVAIIAGFFFMIVHALYVALVAPHKVFAKNEAPVAPGAIPARVPRHSLTARIFHWVMAAAMFTLLFTAFLPEAGVRFNWVLYHWIAGVVFTISICFHIVHSFAMDPWSIWPDKSDVRDMKRRLARFWGKPAPAPARFAKYPLENKLYHLSILLAGLAVIGTGVFMLKRIETPFFTRNPYIFGDMTWGLMYLLHGLAGVGLVALVMMHVYMGLRPEKMPITKSMIFGWMSRDFYLEEHDPARWGGNAAAASKEKRGLAASDAD
jgi:cytochrome b subunit of formate dehydrogenase